jgi:excisionase family DNA binding protein
VLQPSDILTPDQLAQMLQVTRGWITSKTRRSCDNPLPHFRIGKYIRFSRPAVLDWLESTAVPSPKRKR